MAAARFSTLEDYISSLATGENNPRGATVRRIVETIQAEFPTATVKIAWNVPQIQINGQYVFGISAANQWLMLASWSDGSMTRFADRLAGYHVNKRTFRVPIDWQPDRELLGDLIRDRLTELAAR